MVHFLHFYPPPPKNPKNQNFEKIKKPAGDIILHTCTKTHNHMSYGSSDMEWKTVFLSFWAIFCPFTLLTTQKITKNFKMKKTFRQFVILHLCTKNHNHMMFDSRNMECGKHNFLSFWTIFPPFTLILTLKINIWKKCEKTLEISFYICVPQMKIIWSMVPEI